MLGQTLAAELVAAVDGGGEVEEFNLAAVAGSYPDTAFWANEDNTLRVVRQGRVVTVQCSIGHDLPFSGWEPLNPSNPLPASMIPPSWANFAIFWEKGDNDRKNVGGQVEIYTDGVVYLRINPFVDLETSTFVVAQLAFTYLVP